MNFNAGLAIKYKYPNADPLKDVIVFHDNGVWTIQAWHLSDPEPDEATLAQWYIEAQKAAKIVELQQSRDTTIFSTFQSAALGQTYTYTGDDRARQRYDVILARMLRDSTYTSETIFTHEGGWLPHNQAQVTQLVNDGMAHEKSQWDHYNNLLAQVNAITTTDPTQADQQLAAIVW